MRPEDLDAVLAVLDYLETPACECEHRNGSLVYRPVGEVAEPYPDWVRALRGHSGVYVIRDRASGETLYVGESHTGRLYQTLTRHFQEVRHEAQEVPMT